jgi:RIO kinase 1
MELSENELLDDYEIIEAQFLNQNRSYRRQKKGVKRGEKLDPVTIRAELTDFNDNESDFVPSYAARLDPNHEYRAWLIRSVGSFYRDNLITDVSRIVKGGKEANVYCCPANPATGVDLIAAKLYRPRMLRHLRNDALYKEGRMTLDEEGRELRKSREMRALNKKTRFGKHLGFMTWIVHEFQVQNTLYEAGADVPQPIAHRGNTILMAFIGDEMMAAPTLSEVRLETQEAQPLYNRTMRNVELMLSNHFVHGDLSAYNILYWDGHITIIDFPQLVDARTNRNAFMLLERDIRRVSEYFSRCGIKSDPVEDSTTLWESYQMGQL